MKFFQTLTLTRARIASRLPSLSIPAKRPCVYIDYRSISQSPLSPHRDNHHRWRKLGRQSAYAAVTFGILWFLDQEFNASAVARNFRTLWTCALISLDYKLNFQPDKADQIPQLHARVADRMYDLFTSNGGLYIKIGQAIGANAPLLPRPIQDKFGRLFDDAPQIPYSTVLSVFSSEFGRPPTGPDGIFDEFEQDAIASASVAQVHRAKLKNGDWVAVKIQKPDVTKQMEWDLGVFRMVMWMFEKWMFDLPVYFAVDFINSHLRQELDFVQEAQNARVTAQFIAAEPRLAGKVHIPKVYPEYSTKKVLTAEWIDGVRLSDRAAIRRLMGEDTQASSASRVHPSLEGVRLKGGVKAIMQSMVELFSAQMFSWGWVHCDPHPGNIIVRPNPSNSRYPQLVLLDHGLYVRVGESFRREYATLWRALLAADWDAIHRVTTSWGIGTPDLFASATLMRPVKYGGKSKVGNGSAPEEELDQYQMSVRMKAKLKRFLLDTDKMPKELIFLGRNMRIVQGNNQVLGSPVNRIKILGYWASASLMTSTGLTMTERAKEYWRHLAFRGVMLTIDAAFWASKVRQWIWRLLGKPSVGFEDDLEKAMRGFAKSTFGVDVAPGAFEG